ncbi:MAG: Uma2 family endonuclease [Armatimonadota bacterium]|nr:Uma2 family endonuclease [Armatimonadota bacterium]MDR7412367.1 Uma2 family endonuclease [Armatimonadota bacterium]
MRPVLAVEVTSPSTRTVDLMEKAQDYARGGIPEYWVVDAQRDEVTVHRLRGGVYEAAAVRAGRLESESVRGFWLDVGWLFQHPLPPAADCLAQVTGGWRAVQVMSSPTSAAQARKTSKLAVLGLSVRWASWTQWNRSRILAQHGQAGAHVRSVVP